MAGQADEEGLSGHKATDDLGRNGFCRIMPKLSSLQSPSADCQLFRGFMKRMNVVGEESKHQVLPFRCLWSSLVSASVFGPLRPIPPFAQPPQRAAGRVALVRDVV